MAERMTRPVLFGASSARNTATMIPTKVENATERAVAKREATIIGKIPNISAVGCQVVPKIKSSTPILNMAGAPLKKMNTEMMATISTERDAQIKNRPFAPFSIINCFLMAHLPSKLSYLLSLL